MEKNARVLNCCVNTVFEGTCRLVCYNKVTLYTSEVQGFLLPYGFFQVMYCDYLVQLSILVS